jgi:hypothetical protein
MPIDHTAISVEKSLHKETVDFYLAALAPLGYEKVMAFGPNEEATGLGVKPKSDFWIMSVDVKVVPLHFAFTSPGESRFQIAHLFCNLTDGT